LRALPLLLAALSLAPLDAGAEGVGGETRSASRVDLGPRPHYLVKALAPGPLRSELEACRDRPMRPTPFSIGHRGAPLQFPEHTEESYRAAARMGAGRIECDVTFTKDRELVCRHAQCDLHTTTNVLAVPTLAAKCREPFTPADPATGKAASAKCCTSDFTLAEIRTLCGKMDAHDPKATAVEGYLGGTPAWRTDLYAGCGTLITHAESIALLDDLDVDFVPELKEPEVPMPFEGEYAREHYAQQMIDEYEAAGIAPERVWPQSFRFEDLLYWLEHAPAFGRQGVYLDGRLGEAKDLLPASAGLPEIAKSGIRIVAPPLWALLALDEAGRIVPSEYARAARAAGLEIISWTLERSGPLEGGGGWYYQTVSDAIEGDGDMLVVLDVLARQVGLGGIFTDWPATVTYYANCTGLGGTHATPAD
jgi:glycerophosphoryl diester phosphodiesterase